MWYYLNLKKVKTRKGSPDIFILRVEEEYKEEDIPPMDHLAWYSELKKSTVNPDLISNMVQRVVGKLEATLNELDSDAVIKIKLPGIKALNSDSFTNKLRRWSNKEFNEANKCLNCGRILPDEFEFCNSDCMEQYGAGKMIYGEVEGDLDRVLEDY